MEEKTSIRDLRERAGLQIKELSDASGVSTASINRMEKKKLPVSVVLVNKVLRVINERLQTDYKASQLDVLILQHNQENVTDKNRQFKLPGSGL